jgi:serine/threonine-protein kinase
MASFFEELRRRSVFRVGVAYAVVAWILAQVAATVLPVFNAPQWVLQSLFILLAVGFPSALIMAWVYELTPEGPRVTADSATLEGDPAATHRKFDLAVIGLLAFALLFVVLKEYVVGPLIGSQGSRASIAVLAFENMSGDPGQEFLSDGIAEELSTVLAGVPGLRVASRTSSFSFKGKGESLPAIAAALNVKHILEGSVRQDGDRIRITAQLIDVSTDSHLWTESYDRNVANIFAVQDEIALRIKEALQLEILGDDAVPLKARRTENLQAYESYLKGLEAHRRGLPASNLFDAQRHYQQAIELDPDFAQAHARLAGSYIGLGNFRALIPAEAFKQAEAAVMRSLELDPNLAEGHSMLGWVRLSYHWDWIGAEQSFRRAIDIEPSAFAGYQGLSYALSTQGRLDEALTQARKAYDLDPLSAFARMAVRAVYYKQRDFNAAIAWSEKILELAPNDGLNIAFLGITHALRGDPLDLVLPFAERALHAVRDDPSVDLAVALMHALVGNDQQAQETANRIAALRGEEYVSAGIIAAVYANLGLADLAFEWLNRAYDDHDSWLFNLNEPHLDAIRSDPRFEALLISLNIPTDAYR